MGKLTVGLVYGGRNTEHEVSCRSAEFVRRNLDRKKYQLMDIKIDKDGKFDLELIQKAEVIFPVTHGTYGEDGCLQGYLEMLDKPYVGAGVLGSAVGMDKEVQKRLLRQAGIPVAGYQVIRKQELENRKYKINNYPVFVKPANGGSSVGVDKVNKVQELENKVKNAFKYDTKVLIEEAVEGREIEVAVLGDEAAGFAIRASLPGEVVPKGSHEYYDYEAKYLDEKGAELQIPIKSKFKFKSKIREIQNLAIKTFKTLECSGMARVDMFLRPDGKLVINEINTLPGLTEISMYPKLWAVSGITAGELLDRLITIGWKRWKTRRKLIRQSPLRIPDQG